MIRRFARVAWLAGLLGLAASCKVDNLLNQTATFGGETAGQRIQLSVVFINNTPYRAIFTVGTYDDLDQKTEPRIVQFGNDPNGPTLEADTTSAPFGPPCGRVFAVGTAELLGFIEDNLSADGVDQDAMIEGVFFSDAELGSEEGVQPTAGVAPPLERRLGVDFACTSILIVRLEPDDVGPNPFRIAFEVIPAGDTRGPASQ
ncbi:MAG: hypothetical protein V2A79_17565 [Planctomycetota bacterium]